MPAPDPLDLLHADLIALGQQVDKNRKEIHDHKIDDASIHAKQDLYFKLIWIVFGACVAILGGGIGYALKIIYKVVIEAKLGSVLGM